MNVDFSPGQIEILRNLLEKELEEIRSEVHHTKDREFKEGLKEREEAVRSLLARLAG